MTGVIKKPNLRGLHKAMFFPQLCGMIAICSIFGITYKIFVMDARKKQFEEFERLFLFFMCFMLLYDPQILFNVFRTYDDDEALNRMLKADLLQAPHVDYFKIKS